MNDILTILECTVINSCNPEYLEVSYQQDFIFLFIMKSEYKYFPLSERIESVFNFLKWEVGDILNKYPIIVECIDDEEFDYLVKLYGK